MSCGASTRARGGRNPISAASRSLLLDRWRAEPCGFRHLHAIPREGEFGADTREGGAWRRLGGANVWSIISADEDRAFVTEFAIPFSSLVDTVPHIPPQPGDAWRFNLYRIGGKVNFQYSMWSDTWRDKPKYHAPERFGVVHFSDATVGASKRGHADRTDRGNTGSNINCNPIPEE